MQTSAEMKKQVADLLFQEGRVIHRLANLKKGNSAPTFDGGALMADAKRAARYASAVQGLVDESR